MVNANNVGVGVGDKIQSLKKDNNDNPENVVDTNASDSPKINDQKESKGEDKDKVININSADPINNNSINNQIEQNKFEKKFFNFNFFKVDPKWRWLNEIGKD